MIKPFSEARSNVHDERRGLWPSWQSWCRLILWKLKETTLQFLHYEISLCWGVKKYSSQNFRRRNAEIINSPLESTKHAFWVAQKAIIEAKALSSLEQDRDRDYWFFSKKPICMLITLLIMVSVTYQWSLTTFFIFVLHSKLTSAYNSQSVELLLFIFNLNSHKLVLKQTKYFVINCAWS